MEPPNQSVVEAVSFACRGPVAAGVLTAVLTGVSSVQA